MGLSRTQINAGNAVVLTEHARRLEVQGLIADQVFPQLPKNGLENGQLRFWDNSNMRSPEAASRPLNGKATSIDDRKPSYIAWSTVHYAVKTLWTNREQKQWDANGNNPGELKFIKAAKIASQLKILRELDLATKLTSTANYETSYSTTLAAGDRWSQAGSDPLGNITDAKNQIVSGGVFPNTFICDQIAWNELQVHSDLLDMLKYTSPGRVTPEGFAKVTGLNPIIAQGRYETAAQVMTPIWGDSAIICYINPSVGAMSPESDMTFGRTIMSEEMSVVDYEAREYDHNSAIWIEGELGFTHEFIGIDNVTDGDSIAGYLIDNVT